MSKSTQTEKLVSLLEKHLLPLWEHVGLEQLAVSATTLQEFEKQSLPMQMRTSSHKISPVHKRRIEPQNDSTATLLFMARGQAFFHLGDFTLHCPQGHFLVLRPGILELQNKRLAIDSTIFPPQDCGILWFTLLPKTDNVLCWMTDVTQESSKQQTNKFCHIKSAELVNFFNFSMQEILEQTPDYQKTANASLYTFFVLALRELQAANCHLTSRTVAQPTTIFSVSPIESACQYIESHLNSSLTIDNVAQIVFMGRTSFVRHFTEAKGQTFNEYVAARRMQHAAQMLKKENWPMQTICKQIGLQPAQFRNRFKKQFGVCPSKFRSRHRIGDKHP